MPARRIGIVGYGHLGKYLVAAVMDHSELELAFVWNRRLEALENKVEDKYICRDLEQCAQFHPDLIVEVAHPDISAKYGELFLSVADYMMGSPTALANRTLEETLRKAATHKGLYIPAGAFWGGEDILKMAKRGSLKELKITMEKHPSCFNLQGSLKEMNKSVTDSAVTLYDGPVRDLCSLAPNNVNTMAAAAIAAHNLGFDKVQGCLISDPRLTEWHVVRIQVLGPSVAGNSFKVCTERWNPANQGVVTGSATYASFLSSVEFAANKGPGVHLC